jgi:bifunctional DNase/RNase
VITELKEGTFYAELEVLLGGNRHRISSRPSDAIALAVRYEEPVPIFAADAVLEEAGVVFESDDEEEQVEQFREFLERVRPEDFAP